MFDQMCGHPVTVKWTHKISHHTDVVKRRPRGEGRDLGLGSRPAAVTLSKTHSFLGPQFPNLCDADDPQGSL